MEFIRISALWCSSCIITYKDWNKLKTNYPDYEYNEYDYDMDVEMVEKYNIGTTIPVIIALKEGKEIGRIIGEKSYKELETWLKGVLNI